MENEKDTLIERLTEENLRLRQNKNGRKSFIWIVKTTIRGFFGRNLYTDAREFAQGNFSKEKVTDICVGIFHRLTRIGIIALIPIALIVVQTTILYQQKNLLEDQNQKFDLQNRSLRTQNQLLEADRRSSMMLMLDNVMTAMDVELMSSDTISERLIGRIAALSSSFRPYRSMKDSALTSKAYSYERGMLFQMLFHSNYLGEANTMNVLQSTDFSDMLVTKMELKGLPKSSLIRGDNIELESSTIKDNVIHLNGNGIRITNKSFLSKSKLIFMPNEFWPSPGLSIIDTKLIDTQIVSTNYANRFDNCVLIGCQSVYPDEGVTFEGTPFGDTHKDTGTTLFEKSLIIDTSFDYMFISDFISLNYCLIDNVDLMNNQRPQYYSITSSLIRGWRGTSDEVLSPLSPVRIDSCVVDKTFIESVCKTATDSSRFRRKYNIENFNLGLLNPNYTTFKGAANFRNNIRENCPIEIPWRFIQPYYRSNGTNNYYYITSTNNGKS